MIERPRFPPDTEWKVVRLQGELWDYASIAQICRNVLKATVVNFDQRSSLPERRIDTFVRVVGQDIPQGRSRSISFSFPGAGFRVHYEPLVTLQWPDGRQYPSHSTDTLYRMGERIVSNRGMVVDDSVFAHISPTISFDTIRVKYKRHNIEPMLTFVNKLPQRFSLEDASGAVIRARRAFYETHRASVHLLFEPNFRIGKGDVIVRLPVTPSSLSTVDLGVKH